MRGLEILQHMVPGKFTIVCDQMENHLKHLQDEVHWQTTTIPPPLPSLSRDEPTESHSSVGTWRFLWFREFHKLGLGTSISAEHGR